MRYPKFPNSTHGEAITCAVFLFLLCAPYLLVVPSEGYAAIAAWKYGMFLALYIGFILLIAEQRLVSGPGCSGRRGKPDAFDLCILAYFLFTCVSGILSKYPGVFFGSARHDGILTIGLYAASTLLLTRRLRPRRWMLWVFGGAVTLFCLLGMVQLTGANPFRLYPRGYNFYDAGQYYMGQYWGTVGNVNLCAALLSAAAGAFAAAGVRAERRADWFCLIPLALSAFSIVELNSEAGLAALLAGLLLMPPFVVAEGTDVRNLLLTYGLVLLTLAASSAIVFYDGGAAVAWRRMTSLLCFGAGALFLVGALLGRTAALRHVSPAALRKALAGAAAAAAVLGLFTLYAWDGWPDGFLLQAHALLQGNWDDSYGSNRLYIWRQVWALVREAPLLGGGPDTLGFRGLTGFSRFNEATGTVVSGSIDAAHNEYLNILVNQGALALGAYGSALCVSLFRWWKGTGSRARTVAGAAALFYLAQAFFGMSSCITAPYLWMALAIINNKNEGNEKE